VLEKGGAIVNRKTARGVGEGESQEKRGKGGPITMGPWGKKKRPAAAKMMKGPVTMEGWGGGGKRKKSHFQRGWGKCRKARKGREGGAESQRIKGGRAATRKKKARGKA